ncbi:hypothetical protein BLNAU_20121 [Blattamonas nauphoetae]|uniref:Uncharacterized protein n=1 Tax=Blattamonas nauphoetae TaxID=2049346 RepID=A0ABQ9WZL9_9EUKA|nr:hypothetical protein BLNAU_20121 [Blattamonas nauphoetae]
MYQRSDHLPLSLRIQDLPRSSSDTSEDDSEGSEDVVAHLMVVLDPCPVATHTLPLSSASPSPPTPTHSPLPLPHHPHPPSPLCLYPHPIRYDACW